MTFIISKAALSRVAGVSRMAVTKAARGLLLDAVINNKIDVEHALVVEWLASKNVHELPADLVNLADKKTKPKRPGSNPPPPPIENKPPPPANPPPPTTNKPTTIGGRDITELEDLTVREVVMRYGSVDGFKRFVDSLKSIADYKHREIRIQIHRGELISRDLVAGTVFPLVDVAFQRLVTDVPASLTQLIVARVESGGDDTIHDVEKIIRDANSRVLKNAKTSIKKLDILKNANTTFSN